jgi:uncharacterized coiled-coil DUF342 family protein
MAFDEDIDQFQLLEQKIDSLIELVSTLKKEKASLAEQLQKQEENMGGLKERVDRLTAEKDSARQRILSLLNKIEQLEI